jgi:hypothetical protein
MEQVAELRAQLDRTHGHYAWLLDDLVGTTWRSDVQSLERLGGPGFKPPPRGSHSAYNTPRGGVPSRGLQQVGQDGASSTGVEGSGAAATGAEQGQTDGVRGLGGNSSGQGASRHASMVSVLVVAAEARATKLILHRQLCICSSVKQGCLLSMCTHGNNHS